MHKEIRVTNMVSLMTTTGRYEPLKVGNLGLQEKLSENTHTTTEKDEQAES